MPFMELADLVRALMSGDLLAARQWVADARRIKLDWEHCARPDGLDERETAVAAGLAELLSGRDGASPPAWTADVAGNREPLLLDPGLAAMPRSLKHALAESPEPLRRRNIFAPRDFLDLR
jgi:hypothetical protein